MPDEDKTRIAVGKHFVDSGEKQRLLNILRARLAETGWTESLYAFCREAAMKKGSNVMSVDQLFDEASDFGRNMINDGIKKDMLLQIKHFLDNEDEAHPACVPSD